MPARLMARSTIGMPAIRLILADDHALIRAGLRALLKSIEDVEVIAEASNGHETLEVVARGQPDVVLMDIAMPGLNGLETAARILKQWPSIRIIMLSMHANDEYLRRALGAGAAGYLLKGADPAELELALKAVVRGETYLTPAVSKRLVQDFLQQDGEPLEPQSELTPRQREILQLIAEGHSTKEIATRLDLSVKTVETHRGAIMSRLDIHDVPGLVRYAIRAGLITTDG